MAVHTKQRIYVHMHQLERDIDAWNTYINKQSISFCNYTKQMKFRYDLNYLIYFSPYLTDSRFASLLATEQNNGTN